MPIGRLLVLAAVFSIFMLVAALMSNLVALGALVLAPGLLILSGLRHTPLRQTNGVDGMFVAVSFWFLVSFLGLCARAYRRTHNPSSGLLPDNSRSAPQASHITVLLALADGLVISVAMWFTSALILVGCFATDRLLRPNGAIPSSLVFLSVVTPVAIGFVAFVAVLASAWVRAQRQCPQASRAS